ncbi:MAG: hypothetical protein HQ546_07640 [Planctomycetes bacterium]|nr:hypothetical protein [Planctomycetota bacterium]
MGPMLGALLKLQAVEDDLAHVRRRLRSKENAVGAARRKVEELTAQQKALHEQFVRRQSETDGIELERASREEEIVRLRSVLNHAKTNKEYSAILTQMNTYKADNSKLEDEILKIMEGVDSVKAEAEKVATQIEIEQRHLDEVAQSSAQEVTKLNTLMADLKERRKLAVRDVDLDAMRVFERMAEARDGRAMARIEVVDAKSGQYSCGGCYMSLAAEHYSALLSKDEIRRCDSCGCILYIEP